MNLFSILGRFLFVSLFLVSGFVKVQNFDINTGGVMMDMIAPKLDVAFGAIRDHFPQLNVAMLREYYPTMFLASLIMELSGAVLFLLNSTIGAYLLAMFVLSVTPVMHDFWNLANDDDKKQTEMIQFMKNVMILGALLFYIGLKSQVARNRQY